MKVLDAQANKLSTDFIAYRECAPIRSEAILMVEILLRGRETSRSVYEDVLMHLSRMKTVESELINV